MSSGMRFGIPMVGLVIPVLFGGSPGSPLENHVGNGRVNRHLKPPLYSVTSWFDESLGVQKWVQNWAQQAETIAHDTSDLSAFNGWPVICGRELAEGFSLQPLGNFDQQVPLLSADQRPRGAGWAGWPRMFGCFWMASTRGWSLKNV